VSDAPLVSVVVVAYRQREALRECLQALARAEQELAASPAASGRSEGSPAAELIVVDNGELGELVLAARPDARLISSASNIGFAAGAQRGIEAARGEWVALVNDDATVAPDALVRLLAAGRAAPQIGSVAAQIRFHAHPQTINSAGILVDSLGVASERLAGRPVAEAAEGAEVFGASGCVALYNARMLEQLGGLDGRFFAYQEDVDLAWRARATGWSAVYEPRAVAHHRGSASTGEGSRTKYRLVGRNRMWLLARNATTRQLLSRLPAIVLYDLAYVLYVALSDRTAAPLWGRLEGLRSWRAMRAERGGMRAEVRLAPARSGWLGALRQHLAYRDAGRGGVS
jgi:GT2 family glycosyltransferase